MKRSTVALLSLASVLTAFAYLSFLPVFESDSDIALGEVYVGAAAIDYSEDTLSANAESAVLIDLDSRSVLFSKNADKRRGMASTTKIMTALVAIENCAPSDEISIPAEAVGVEGSSVYLQEGETLTLYELLMCLMLESGNDSATAIAIHCGGSIEAFAEMMNKRAEELKLENTHFINPHGLSAEGHYTTAHDLAMITAEAMQYPLFCEIVSTKMTRVRYGGIENGRILVNHNKMLFGYSGATGGKTGYTKADGKCLVSSAERDGLHLIAVTLNDYSPTQTHRHILDMGFERFEKVIIAEKGTLKADVPIKNGMDSYLTVTNCGEVSVCLPKGARYYMELVVPDTVNAPIKEGEITARAKCISDGKEVYIINLEAVETIAEKKKTFWEKLFGD